jgi:hypothetical protein
MCRALYWIWNEKSHMLKLVVELNIFQSTYFAWIDIGAVRYNIYQWCWTGTAGTAIFCFRGIRTGTGMHSDSGSGSGFGSGKGTSINLYGSITLIFTQFFSGPLRKLEAWRKSKVMKPVAIMKCVIKNELMI